MPASHRAASLILPWLLVGCLATATAGDTSAPPVPQVQAQRSYGDICQELIGSASALSDTQRLHSLFEANWAWRMQEYPTWATYVGHPGQNHRWTDVSMEANERRQAEVKATAQVLATLHRDALSAEDQLNFDLFKYEIEDTLASFGFPWELMPLNQMSGVQQEISSTLESMPTYTEAQYEDILSRMRAAPELIDQTLTLMRLGVEKGIMPPRVVLLGVPAQIDALLSTELDGHPLLMPFDEMPAAFDDQTRARLNTEARRIVVEQMQPAFKRLHAYVVETYLPAARGSIALSALPGGAAAYAQQARHHTTTDLSPQQIHEIGLSEVARIRAQMDEVIKEAGFEGSFAEFATFLRTDPRFFHTSEEALLSEYRDIAKRADPQLIKLFGTLPRLPYGVKAIPGFAAPNQTTAFYSQGSLPAGRPGWFYANTYNLQSRPRWEMEALTLHEAVPGHHLQISIAQELEGVPTFRQQMGTSAYVEGWGLYAESLGYDMGFYQDPYSHFGQLTYEMWRAVRLVVDTGMHSLGWTREQAIAYFVENAGKSEHDITVEVDRYISWPGQALAYKIGQLKISELRHRAEQTLGGDFDVRSFHDMVLECGAVPLSILEARADAWIAAQRSRP